MWVIFFLFFALAFCGCGRKKSFKDEKVSNSQHDSSQTDLAERNNEFKEAQEGVILQEYAWKLTSPESNATIIVIGTTHLPSAMEDFPKISAVINDFHPDFFLGEIDLINSALNEDRKRPLTLTQLRGEFSKLNVAALDCLGMNRLAAKGGNPPLYKENFLIDDKVFDCIQKHPKKLSKQVPEKILNAFFELNYYQYYTGNYANLALFYKDTVATGGYEYLGLRTLYDYLFSESLKQFSLQSTQPEQNANTFNSQDEALAHYLSSKNAKALESLDKDQSISDLYKENVKSQEEVVATTSSFSLESIKQKYSNVQITANSLNPQVNNDTKLILYYFFQYLQNQVQSKIDEIDDGDIIYRNKNWAKRVDQLFAAHGLASKRVNIYLFGGTWHFLGKNSMFKFLNPHIIFAPLVSPD